MTGAYSLTSIEDSIHFSAKSSFMMRPAERQDFTAEQSGIFRHKMWYPPFSTGQATRWEFLSQVMTLLRCVCALRCKDTNRTTRNDHFKGVGAKQINSLRRSMRRNMALRLRSVSTVPKWPENQEGRRPVLPAYGKALRKGLGKRSVKGIFKYGTEPDFKMDRERKRARMSRMSRSRAPRLTSWCGHTWRLLDRRCEEPH